MRSICAVVVLSSIVTREVRAQSCESIACIGIKLGGAGWVAGGSGPTLSLNPVLGAPPALPTSMASGKVVGQRMVEKVVVTSNPADPFAPTSSGLTPSQAVEAGEALGSIAGRDLSSNATSAGIAAAQARGTQNGAAVAAQLGSSGTVVGVHADPAVAQMALVPALPRHPTTADTGADPVDTATGEFTLSKLDFHINGVGLDFTIHRTYRSRWRYDGPLGFGWDHSYNERLLPEERCPGIAYTWMTGTASTVRFERSVDGGFVATPPVPFRIVEPPIRDGTLFLVGVDGIARKFDAAGRLELIYDTFGNSLAFAWEPSAEFQTRLREARDSEGRAIAFRYGADGRLDAIEAIEPVLGVGYTIDDAHDLREVTSPAGFVESYTYSMGHPSAGGLSTEHATELCIAACAANDGLCSPSPGACDRAVGQQACVAACASPSAVASCRTSCEPGCEGACQGSEASCMFDCGSACDNACDADFGAACEAEFTATNGMGECFEGCKESCEAACGEGCQAFVAARDGVAGLFDALLFFGVVGAIVADVLKCVLTFFIACDATTIERAVLAFCHEDCTRCCRFGEGCPEGSCQAGRNCQNDCRTQFLIGATVQWGNLCTSPPQGFASDCPTRVRAECAATCRGVYCAADCAKGCFGHCTTACDAACQEPGACAAHCGGSDFGPACAERCVGACVQQLTSTSREVFGAMRDANHNLLTIADGDGRRLLANRYGEDPLTPHFDRVEEQVFGATTTRWRYVRIKDSDVGEAVAELNRPRTDLASRAICGREHDNAKRPVQRFSLATEIIDGNGAQWLYLSDREGHVLRAFGPEGARWDRTFDDLGRIDGERTAFGDRSCWTYDDEWNVTSYVRFPRPDLHAEFPDIRMGYVWAPFARLREERLVFRIFGFDYPLTLRTYDWGAHGELRGFARGFAPATTFEPDARGRVASATTPSGSVTRYTYDPANGLWRTLTLDADGPAPRTITATRDGRGVLASLVSDAGAEEHFEHDSDGRLEMRSRRLDPSLQLVSVAFSYDAAGDLESIDDGQAHVELDHDERGNLVARRERPAGTVQDEVTCYRYDGRSALVEVVDAAGDRTRLTRDREGRVTRIERGDIPSSGAWDDSCRASSMNEAVAGGRESTFEVRRAAGGVVDRVVSPFGTVTLEYDGFGRIYEVVRPDGTRSRTSHDRLGNLAWSAELDEGGAAEVIDWVPDAGDLRIASFTRYGYDTSERFRWRSSAWFIDEPDGRRTLGNGSYESRVDYDDAGSAVTLTAPDGSKERIEFDGLGRVERREADGQKVVSHLWSSDGRRRTSTYPKGASGSPWTVTETYLASGQRTRSEFGGRLDRETVYDDLGRVVLERDAYGARVFGYDALGRLERRDRVSDAGARATDWKLGRDPTGRVVRMTDGTGAVTRQRYDVIGRLVSRTAPSGAASAWSWWPGSKRLRGQWAPDGASVHYEYDDRGALRSAHARTGPDDVTGVTRTFTWSATGLASATSSGPTSSPDDDHATTFSRDSLGLVWREQTSSSVPIEVERDRLGREIVRRHGASTVTTTYEPLGRLETVSLDGALVARYGYAGVGPPGTVELGNGLHETRVYDDYGRLSAVSVGHLAGAGDVARAELGYVQSGGLVRVDVTSADGGTLSSVFEHDEWGRVGSENAELAGLPPLTGSGIANADVTAWIDSTDEWTRHIYDGAGNHRQVERANLTLQLTTDGDNRLVAAGGAVLADTSGNVRETPEGLKVAYDGFGRVVSAVRGASSWTFAYDGLGRLARLTHDGIPEDVSWFEGRVSALHASGAVRLLIQGATASPVAMGSTAAGLRYLHEGHAGRTMLVTDAQGAVLDRLTYDSFGSPTRTDALGQSKPLPETLESPWAMGRFYLGGANIWLFDHRWYNPVWGRYMSPDPLGPADGLNMFAYVDNQPVGFVDPTGLMRVQLANAIDDAAYGMLSMLNGARDGALPPPLFPAAGPFPGHQLAYDVGTIIGSATGLGFDALEMVFGGTLFVGGSGLLVAELGDSETGLAAAGAGVSLVALGAYGAGLHGQRFIQGLQHVYSEGRSDGPSGPRKASSEATPRSDAHTSRGAAGTERNSIGRARAERVADVLNGVALEVNELRLPSDRIGGQKVEIDVIGADESLNLVGGPNKARKLDAERQWLMGLKDISSHWGVPGRAWYTHDTPVEVFEQAIEILGAENVFIIPP